MRVSLKEAFSIVELIIAVAIIGLVMAIIPRIAFRQKKVDWLVIETELNDLLLYGRQEAMKNRMVYALNFKVKEDLTVSVSLEKETNDFEKPSVKILEPLKIPHLDTTYKFSENIRIRSMHVNGKNVFERKQKSYPLYISIDGLVQKCTLQLTYIGKNKQEHASFCVKPFEGKFKKLT